MSHPVVYLGTRLRHAACPMERAARSPKRNMLQLNSDPTPFAFRAATVVVVFFPETGTIRFRKENATKEQHLNSGTDRRRLFATRKLGLVQSCRSWARCSPPPRDAKHKTWKARIDARRITLDVTSAGDCQMP